MVTPKNSLLVLWKYWEKELHFQLSFEQRSAHPVHLFHNVQARWIDFKLMAWKWSFYGGSHTVGIDETFYPYSLFYKSIVLLTPKCLLVPWNIQLTTPTVFMNVERRMSKISRFLHFYKRYSVSGTAEQTVANTVHNMFLEWLLEK